LAPATGYLEWSVLWFFSVSPGEFWDSTLKLSHDHFIPHLFQVIIITLSSTLYSLVTDKASLIKVPTILISSSFTDLQLFILSNCKLNSLLCIIYWCA
jgi:hypothetical protein